MKVCWSIVRHDQRKHGKLVREDLIKDLIDMGIPEDIANQLLYKDRIEFFGVLDGNQTQVALDLIFDNTLLS